MLFAVCAALAAQSAAPSDGEAGAYYQFVLGLHLETAGDAAGAAAAYEQAEKLDPKSAEIPAALAALYARMNRAPDAIAAGERAVKADPDNPEANWILGNLYANTIERPMTRSEDRLAYEIGRAHV